MSMMGNHMENTMEDDTETRVICRPGRETLVFRNKLLWGRSKLGFRLY